VRRIFLDASGDTWSGFDRERFDALTRLLTVGADVTAVPASAARPTGHAAGAIARPGI
jgi:hypothetical protein